MVCSSSATKGAATRTYKCMSRPSNSQPSQAAIPDFHCCGDRSRRRVTSCPDDGGDGSPDGGVLRLKDVARIELGAGEYALRSLLNNKPAVAIAIFQAPESNAIALSNDAYKFGVNYVIYGMTH